MAMIEAIGIPDTKLCKEITELVRDTEPELLFNHSSRVYYFGALTGLRRGLRFDRELLYAGAMFQYLMLVRSQATNHRPADRTGCAGDQNSHRVSPFTLLRDDFLMQCSTALSGAGSSTAPT